MLYCIINMQMRILSMLISIVNMQMRIIKMLISIVSMLMIISMPMGWQCLCSRTMKVSIPAPAVVNLFCVFWGFLFCILCCPSGTFHMIKVELYPLMSVLGCARYIQIVVAHSLKLTVDFAAMYPAWWCWAHLGRNSLHNSELWPLGFSIILCISACYIKK